MIDFYLWPAHTGRSVVRRTGSALVRLTDKVDTMSETIQAFRADIERAQQSAKLERDKLAAVILEYPRFKQEVQAALADASMMWAQASLASHPEGAAVRAYFFSLLDFCYARSEAAESTLTQRELGLLKATAAATQKRVLADSNRIFKEASAALRKLREDHAFRIVGEALWGAFQAEVSSHANPGCLQELIVQCYTLSTLAESFQLGLDVSDDFVASLRKVATAVGGAKRSVAEAIQAGRLLVSVDGAIHRPE